MKYVVIFVCLCQLWAGCASAGTFTLLSGEKLTFTSEKEFVAILLEEFLPPEFVGEGGFFLMTDNSKDKTDLRKLLVQTEELHISEVNPTAIYPSLDALRQSVEYSDMGKDYGYENVFAVEIALNALDMIAVYRLPSSRNNSVARGIENPEVIIDATGEGEFKMIEE